MHYRRLVSRTILNIYKRRKQHATDLCITNCLHAIRTTVRKTRYCFFISHSQSAWASTRLVEPIADLDNFIFWIGTNPHLRKVGEIQANPNVTLAFGNSNENANVIVYGNAVVVSEASIKRRYWKSRWRLFFPHGPNHPEYVVIRVEAQRMEVMSFRRNVIAEPFGLRPMVLINKEGQWVVQE